MLKRTMLLLVLTASFLAHADEDVNRICEYTKVDDRSSLRSKLDDAGIDLRRSYDDIKCESGDSLLRVAAANGSVEAATFIISKVGKRVVNDPGKDGVNALQWAQKKADASDSGTKTKMKAVIDLMQKSGTHA